jgi:hypothetical protein
VGVDGNLLETNELLNSLSAYPVFDFFFSVGGFLFCLEGFSVLKRPVVDSSCKSFVVGVVLS